MTRHCEITGVGPIKGSHIWRSGKAKKKGGIGTHITAITKRRFLPNLQRVKAVIDGEVRYVRVSAKALKKGVVIKAPKRTWTKEKPRRPQPLEQTVLKSNKFACGILGGRLSSVYFSEGRGIAPWSLDGSSCVRRASESGRPLQSVQKLHSVKYAR